jgi:hypothetical protein
MALGAQAAVLGGVPAMNSRRTKVGYARDGAVSDFVRTVGRAGVGVDFSPCSHKLEA